jgi:predicted nucleic acid-binding protein
MILFDSNILIFAHNVDSPKHPRAKQLIDTAFALDLKACIAHQNILEFFSVITSSKRVENSLSLKDTFHVIENYLLCEEITKIYPSTATLSKAIYMAKKLSLNQAEIFDCYLAQTMLDNNVFTIYTENTSDFRHYPGIKAIDPF